MRIHLFLTLITYFFSFDIHAQGRCRDLFKFTTKEVREDIAFHNKEVRELFKNGITAKTLTNAAKVFTEKGTLDIPVTDKGFVAAANVGNHHGGYGRFLWFRDFARVQMGLSVLPKVIRDSLPAVAKQKEIEAEKVRLAQLALIADQQWTELAIKNIENADLHIDGGSGFKSVIWIRRLLDPFLEGRPATAEEIQLESSWGHKQNDALAVFANSFFDILHKNQMRADAVPEQARLNIMLLAAYFVRLNYWKMWDVGAWEENMGQRASSIAMVTSFLERFHEGLYKPQVKDNPNQLDLFFQQLRESGAPILERHLSKSTYDLTLQLLRNESFKTSIHQAYGVLYERLMNSQGPIIEAKNDTPTETRFEDTALVHIFWHPLKNMNTYERKQLLDRLSILERKSGYVRYANDWFLYGSAQAAQHANALSPLGTLAVPDAIGGYRRATPQESADLLQAYATKDMDRVIAIAGKDLEAQWTLPDSYLVQIYADAYIKTQNPEFLEKAKKHFERTVGLITGKGEINSEGSPVEAWRLPEAYVPVQMIKNDGIVETHYLVSPNSPLNWSIAEFILALDKIKTAVEFSEAQ